ncbi:MAG: hypothetical protein H7246_20965 [Phycisphaerae bacterium]|nr:hypothetical protein [Saprospiraceae bacterium]
MRNLITLALLGIVFNACQTDPIKSHQEKLTKLDKEMGGAAVTDKSKAAEFIKTSEELAALHHEAHEVCYIANSIKSDVIIKT